MVAASKMRKAIEAVLRTRTYANLSWATVLNLSRAGNGSGEELHPLLKKRDQVRRVGIVLITSNRGLCGGFNMAIINKVHESIKKYHMLGEEVVVEAEFVLMGKKGAGIHHHGHKIIADFPKLDLASEVSEIVPVAQLLVSEFLAGTYDKIMVAYTDYVSASKQVPRVKQLLPVDISTQDEFLGIVGQDSRLGIDKEFIKEKEDEYLKEDKFIYDYTFEPSPNEVLDQMIPRLIEVQLFQALLEANASEHSARMNAMHQATEAAEDMVSELKLFYNKARQAAITAEIAEISAGANALR
ncbi:ATP synthase F1 subunit gamma [Candidatus Falkowbacteria bacterium CG11_big_fil_rev_8_21_14_0_20_39_10]|uniref:ATP synthase F1 subunit gamma n=1 Tax=Candidatus Falkowbacteria bacterium CG11_big_fil_rev_8_21_14_0_20_39_10 TaxID=1974570 RepID=A0A2M6K838_9BACT|nr:MAG: ATP synthase F1 subunit gamma [Candidatus Falkowbacteria bacterium CG11_big_fil_rev_8_21_14_0_20_39_10]